MLYSPSGTSSDESTGPAVIRFECQLCAACCKHDRLIVTVAGRDIARIAASLNLSAEEITRALDFYIIGNDEQIPEGLKHIPRVKTEQGLAYVALKKADDSSCVFLNDDNLCMIHPVRPSTCISFPFFFDDSKNGLKWGLSALRHICPGIDRGKKVTQSFLLETGTMVLEDLDIYKQFVKEWNTSNEAPTALDFIRQILTDVRFNV
ncbi:MAG: YkgJ family cysteine cluster protein [Candidatus Thorarchaeota archaeon]